MISQEESIFTEKVIAQAIVKKFHFDIQFPE